MKKEYKKPTTKVILPKLQCRLLAGSGDPIRNVPLWSGEGGARGMRRTSIDDDLDCEE